ncbi:hypothetical protein [Rubinisphaera sp.]|uniref:hypothetical protein n=1 Tax=Rubinisphaera sp. TaxID=2024857 RepID=UPI000C0CC3FD|nr:hypothetical protein [Rubinisphaera sp.]MBV09485.1 hypothetical protein [Rubinisphaera sp.]
MITISRSLIRRLRITFSRGLGITARQSGPTIDFQCGPQGLFIRTQNDQIALEYHQPGEQPDVSIALPFDFLRRCEGTKDEPVTLSLAGDSVTAEWTDSGIPQSAQFEQEVFGDFPSLPEQMAANPARLLEALGAAAEVADNDSSRYALNHLRLRSRDGQIAASDGRQLLLQSGFSFPWDNEVLIPANRLLSSSDLRSNAEVQIGCTEDWTCLRSGPWTVWLLINKKDRFPQVDDVAPSVNSVTSTMLISDADAEFLSKAVKRLPSNDNLNHPVTVDLNGAVSIRAQGTDDPQPTEVVLTSSRRDGEAIKISTNRHFLARAVQMGFRAVEVHGQESPLVCREPERTYVWAALGKAGIIAATPEAIRIESERVTNTFSQPTRRKHFAMPKTESHAPQNRLPKTDNTELESSLTPLQAAEALRDSLKVTLTHTRELIAALKKRKKQSRLVESTLASLKQLQEVA